MKLASFPMGSVKGTIDRAKELLRRVERVAEIGMLFIELVYHHEARQQKFIRVLPRLFSLHLDAVNTVDNDQRAICDA